MAYNQNNIFARIIRGELPCKKVHENEHPTADITAARDTCVEHTAQYVLKTNAFVYPLTSYAITMFTSTRVECVVLRKNMLEQVCDLLHNIDVSFISIPNLNDF